VEGRSTVEDRLPRNSYHRVYYVFAARASVWDVDSYGQKESCLGGGPDPPTGRGTLGVMLTQICSRSIFSTLFAMGNRSVAAYGYQHCSNLLLLAKSLLSFHTHTAPCFANFLNRDISTYRLTGYPHPLSVVLIIFFLQRSIVTATNAWH